MRHVLIINPAAGRKNSAALLMDQAKVLREQHGLDCQCILTKNPGHATDTCRAIAETGEPARFYACGGDGTLNEVVNGILGCPNAAVTCVPTGTGNDFLKNFGEAMLPRFLDLEALWDGPERELDVIDCNGRAALTIACNGFDARVARDVHTYGRQLRGKGSYIASLAVNFLIRGLSQRWRITLDGEELPERDFVLAAVCNGRYYGGGFFPVPQARMDDGVLQALIVKKVSRATFLRFVGHYAKGEYACLPDSARCYTPREILIQSLEGDIVTCLDGELLSSPQVRIALSDKKVRFFGPPGCDPNATAAGEARIPAFVNNL